MEKIVPIYVYNEHLLKNCVLGILDAHQSNSI